MGVYIFIVTPADRRLYLSREAIGAAEAHLPARVREYSGAVRFIGACEAESAHEARSQLETRLGTLPATVPPLIIADVHQ